ncbi:MAG: 50S ribosomal protein L21e, partial [Euryarchaeota archaeon]|nr:50S ribosomal protein L21e [Euryarchaeota archaeon]
PKFQGRTGKVKGQRGRAYIVEVRDGGLMKEVIALPEHLTPQK